MYRFLVSSLLVTFFAGSLLADDCESIRAEFKVPVNLKTRGKPKVGKWEKVDEVLNGVAQNLETVACEFAFGELFRNKNEGELYFPLTNTVVRLVPEESLAGVEVFNKEGEALGVYSNRVRYERSGGLQWKQSYETYYFQFTDSAGKLQSVGHQLLLDSYVVRWMDIRGKVAVSGR